MKTATKVIGAAAVLALFSSGCEVLVTDPGDYGSHGHSTYGTSYVDTWLPLPNEVRDLIAPSVEGYFSPSVSRYDNYLYPRELPYNSSDLPCYVKADYNGDGYSDYAMLFSRESISYGERRLTTKMIVVLSTWSGW